jgi:hypothetical protein
MGIYFKHRARISGLLAQNGAPNIPSRKYHQFANDRPRKAFQAVIFALRRFSWFLFGSKIPARNSVLSLVKQKGNKQEHPL